MSVAPSHTMDGHSMASQRKTGDRARRDVISLLERLRSFHRQPRMDQVDKIRRCRVSHTDPESDLSLILNRQNIFRGLQQDEQMEYACDLYEFRNFHRLNKHDDKNVLFVCPLITQFIQTIRGGQFIRTGTNNWFQWFSETHERYTWEMTQEEELALQNHIFQYQSLGPQDQPVQLPPIQQYPLPQTSLPPLTDQLHLSRPVDCRSQPNASNVQHNRHHC